MTLQKNVASQKVHFLMVDSTDFATPETGVTVSAFYFKDAGARSTCSNTVSETTSGLYRLTPAATETDAGAVTFQFTGSGCADQFLVFYPETGYSSQLSSIEADTTAIYSALSDFEATTAGDVTEIKSDITAVYSALSDLEATIVSDITAVYSSLSDFEATIVSDVTAVKSSVSDVLAMSTGNSNIISQILVDTATTLDNKIDSILADTQSIIVDVSDVKSAVDDIESNLSNAISTLDGPIDSAITQNTGLISDILSTIDGPVISDLSNIESTVAVLGGDSDKITSILADTGTTLDNKIDSVLADTKEINSQADSILADTQSLIVDASDIKSVVDVLGGDSDKITSILADTQSIIVDISELHESVISDIAGLGAGSDSAILSTLDGPVITVIGDKVTSILTDTNTTLDNKLDSILADTQSIIVDASDIKSAVDDIESNLSNAISTIDGPIHSTLDAMHSTLDAAGVIQVDTVAISGSTDAADKLEDSAETIVQGTAATGTLSTTEMTTDLTISVNDQYNGRILIFKSDTTTAALRGQATDITDTVTTNGHLTFTALTTAPANGDSFVIV